MKTSPSFTPHFPWTPRFARSGFGAGNRAGFALIFVLMSLTLLLTFLLAAQGTVMAGRHEIKRSADRMTELEYLNQRLAETQTRLEREIRSGARKPGESWFYGSGDSILLLNADDPVYAGLSGIVHRDGDALAALAQVRNGRETKMEFLMNGTGRRVGLIRIR